MTAQPRTGRPFQRSVPVTAANTFLAAPNPKRKAIIISLNDPGSLVAVTINIPGAAQVGLQLSPAAPNVLLTEHDFGKLPEAEFRGTATLQGAPALLGAPFNISLGQTSTAAAADLLIAQPAAGVQAVINYASVTNFTGGAPTVQLVHIRAGNTVVIEQVTAASILTPGIVLGPTDQLKWACTVGVAGSKVDVDISGLSTPAVGGSPAAANVTVTEVEG